MSVIIPKDCFHQPQVADLRLIACPGAEELTNLIDKHLVRWASEAGYQTDSFIIESACPRFQSGDAKGLVKESVRGDDIFIVWTRAITASPTSCSTTRTTCPRTTTLQT